MNLVNKHPRLILSLIAAIALLPGIFQLPLMDRDEPRFSHATIEMMDRNDWVVPYFNDEYRFDKPPLTYWWMRLHYTVFGKHEFAARLHSTTSAWLIAILVFQMAGSFGLSRERSVLAGAMWLCCFQVLIHGRMAVADMPLILFLVLSQWAQWEMLRDRGGKFLSKWFWIFHVAVGFGFLAKGPLAYLIPLLTLGVYALILALSKKSEVQRESLRQTAKVFGMTMSGIPLSFGIMALWGIPAMIQTDGQYFDIGIGKHVVERATVSMNKRKVVYWIYLVYMMPFLLPWSAQIIRTIKSGFDPKSPQFRAQYLIAWFISPFLIFSFMKTQLPHYILPGYPAFMLLLAGMIGLPFKRSVGGRIVSVICITFAGLISLAAFVGCVLIPTEGEVAPMKGLFLSLALLGAFLFVGGIMVYRNGKVAGWQGLVFAGLASLMMIPAGYFGRQAHATVRLMEYLSTDRATERAAWGFQEGTLTWYPSDFWKLGHPDRVEGFAEADEMLFQTRRWRVDDDFLEDLKAGDTPAPVSDKTEEAEGFVKKFGMQEVARIQGWNPGNSCWVEIIVAKRP